MIDYRNGREAGPPVRADPGAEPPESAEGLLLRLLAKLAGGTLSLRAGEMVVEVTVRLAGPADAETPTAALTFSLPPLQGAAVPPDPSRLPDVAHLSLSSRERAVLGAAAKEKAASVMGTDVKGRGPVQAAETTRPTLG